MWTYSGKYGSMDKLCERRDWVRKFTTKLPKTNGPRERKLYWGHSGPNVIDFRLYCRWAPLDVHPNVGPESYTALYNEPTLVFGIKLWLKRAEELQSCVSTKL